MPTTDYARNMGEGEKLAQHAHWLSARDRLWSGRLAPVVRPITTPHPQRDVAPPPSWGAPVNLLELPGPRTLIILAGLKRGVRSSDMTGPCRTRDVVAARDDAIALIWTHCRAMSLPTVGRMFGRDHTTVLHSLRKRGLHGDHFYLRKDR